jgi:DHA1 family bicyclomycin/chloramphenicol resistance-like MFS transporter
MVTLVAPMLGPMIGGSLTVWMSWRYIFALLCMLAVITALLIYRKMPETGSNSMAQRPRFFPSAITLGKHAVFCRYVMSLIFAAGMYWSFQTGAPFLVMEVMQVSPARYGMFFLFTALGYGAGNYLSGRFAVSTGTDRMIAYAMIPGLIGIALFWLFADILHPLALFGPMFLIAMCNGLTIPSATASALSARPELAGTAAGLAGFLQIGTGALLSMLVGFIQNGRFWPMLTVITISGLLSAWVVYRPRRAAVTSI